MHTKQYIESLFSKHSTLGDIIKELGMDPKSGGGYRTLKSYVQKYNIDTSELSKKRSSIRKQRLLQTTQKHTKETAFIACSSANSSRLKQIILSENILPYVCSECQVGPFYNGKQLTLQLDHINGDNRDNRITNLRFLCPNCHSQTNTYGSKNRKYGVTKRTKQQYLEAYHRDRLNEYKDIISQIENSGIDFSKYGWSKQVSKILGKPTQKVASWMRRYMPELYEKQCFKRKNWRK